MAFYHTEPIAPTFGARISGLDLTAPLGRETTDSLIQDLTRYRLLVLPGQQLSHADHTRVSRIFGPLDSFPIEKYVVPDHPEVLKISNIFENGQPIGLYDGDEQEEWHTDYSFKEVMSRASLLYSAIAPSEGGDTLFSDTTAAYEDLSDVYKERINDLYAVHSMAYLVAQELKMNPHKTPLTPEELEQNPDIKQPLIHLHPTTGRRSLLLGSMIISGIVGMDTTESFALLDELHAHATRDKYVYRHHWNVGDLVIWDNQATMHTRTACDSRYHKRLLYRTTVL